MATEQRPALAREIRALLPQLRAAAQALCGDPTRAEDLVQDTLVRAWRSLDQFSVGTNLRAWMFTILRNGFYSERRRAWRQQPLDPSDAEKILGPDDPSACLELLDVRRAMARLPQDQREAVLLIGGAGLSHEEAARLAGCAVGTMKSRVSRGREALRRLLDGARLGEADVPARFAFAAFAADIDRAAGRLAEARPRGAREAAAAAAASPRGSALAVM